MGADVIPLARRRPALDAESLLHDMRGPLSAIRGQCHAIVRCAADPSEMIDRLGIIDREVDRVLGLIGQLRAGLRGVARDLCHVPVDLHEIVRAVARRYDGLAGEAGITLRVDGPLESALVVGAAEELRRIVDNLVMNAIQHAPNGSTVTVRIDLEHDAVLLRVIDEGRGLDVAGDHGTPIPAATGTGGWGIGMAIVNDIVARHAGRLSIDRRAHGACVNVALPADGAVVEAGPR
jgi:signal transduction histidine kinase